MRIVAGSLGGRVIASPKSKTIHPMSEKMRGALFAILGDITDLSVLDAYSGSGALAIEANSRGAKPIIALDKNRLAIATIEANIRALKLKDIKAIQASVESWLKTNNSKYDLILADPPYNHLSLGSLNILVERLNKNGLLALSWPTLQELPTLSLATKIKSKSFGDSSLGFYRHL